MRGGSDAFDRFYLAIGLGKTGKYRAAREHHAAGVKWLEQNKTADDLELARLRTELEELLASLPAEARKPIRQQD